MLKLTKFLSLHNEFFSQNIPIRTIALTRIAIVLRVNVLSSPEVIGFGIDGVSGLNSIPLESVLKILAIAVIGSLMCLSMKIQKEVIDEAIGRFSMCIHWRLKWIRSCWRIDQWQ